MSADRAPCNDRLVVHVSASRAAEVRERAEALIGIADPAFQDELVRAAKERKLLT